MTTLTITITGIVAALGLIVVGTTIGLDLLDRRPRP